MGNNQHQRFSERYANQDTPWDSGITPPEIVAVVKELPGGKALDLGCGTGTVMRHLLEREWHADGIDFVQQAVDIARERLARYPSEQFGVYCHDVTQLGTLDGLRPLYDLVIDIGCGHNLSPEQHAGYAQSVADVLRPSGTFMLYARQYSEESGLGFNPQDVTRRFSPHFDVMWQQLSKDTAMGFPSGWYRLRKR